MITFKMNPLLALKDQYPALVEVAEDAVGRTPDVITAELEMYARRGLNCVTMYEDEVLIGYVLYGAVEKFISWPTQLNLLMKLRSMGIQNINTVCHVHIRKAYWKTGHQKQLSREFTKYMLAEGTTHLLLWGYATDQLAEYSIKQPGSQVLEGLLDPNGRIVGVRDLATYLAETETSNETPQGTVVT